MVFKSKWGFYGFVLAILAVAVGSHWVAPMALGPLSLTPTQVLSLLGSIFVVTLFVERAQEVILTNWRAYGSEALDLALVSQEKVIEGLSAGQDAEALHLARQRLDELRHEKLRYRARTRIYALRIGVIMGLGVSMAGLRTLGALMPAEALLGLGQAQQIIFHTMDVIITGGVIAGGSDGIHKMAEWYRVAMESRSRSLRRLVE